MATLLIFHEVNDGKHWAKAWKKGTGSRQEMFAKYGIKARTFKDESNPNSTGVLLEVPDMNKWKEIVSSEDTKKAMAEDGLKVETFKVLSEFTP